MIQKAFDCIWFGVLVISFLIYLVTFIVGIAWEVIFVIVRGHGNQ